MVIVLAVLGSMSDLLGLCWCVFGICVGCVFVDCMVMCVVVLCVVCLFVGCMFYCDVFVSFVCCYVLGVVCLFWCVLLKCWYMSCLHECVCVS